MNEQEQKAFNESLNNTLNTYGLNPDVDTQEWPSENKRADLNNHDRFDDIFGGNGNGDDTNYLTPEEYAERDTDTKPEITSDEVLETIATYNSDDSDAEQSLNKMLDGITGQQREQLIQDCHQRLSFTNLISKTAGQDYKLFKNNGAYNARFLDALSKLEHFYVDWQFPA